MVVTYDCKTWTLKKKEQETLRRFEIKIARRVYGPDKEDDEWRIRNNKGTDDLLNHEDVVTFIKAQGIRWLGRLG